MAVVATINMESGVLATEFPEQQSGTWSFVGSPIFEGALALQFPWSATSSSVARSFTAINAAYSKMALRMDVTANPTAQIDSFVMARFQTAAGAQIAGIDCLVAATTGVLTLRLINFVNFGIIGTFTFPAGAPYHTVDLKCVVDTGTPANGQLEFRVDEVVRATTSATNLGTTPIGRFQLSPSSTLNSATGSSYWDAILIDDAAYPTYVNWDQTHYRWRDDNGDQASASPLAAEDTGITRTTLLNTRLRVLTDTAGGDPPTVQRQLEWNRAAANAIWLPVEVLGGAAAAFGAGGTTSAATGSATAPIATYPTGITKGQLLVMFVTNKPETSTVATPAGWTVLTNSTATGGAGVTGTDTGVMRGTVFVREADGTETGTITLAITGGNSAGVKILRYTKTTGRVWDIAITNGADNAAGATYSAAAGASPGFLAGDILLICTAPCSDCAIASQAVSHAGVTFGTLVNRDTTAITTGGDTKVQMDEFPVTSITTPSGVPTYTMTASGTGSTTEAGVSLFVRIRQVTAPMVLSDSAFFSSGGGGATTAQLTAPGGHTFTAGNMSDDTNPLPTVNLPLNGYTEDEFCLQATATALTGEVYQFRETLNGTPLNTYTKTPDLTIGTPAAGLLYTQLEGATGRGLFRGMAGKMG